MHYVSKQKVILHAKKFNNPRANDAAGIVLPTLLTDQKKLHYEQRKRDTQIEFRFKTGNLILTLEQKVFIDQSLNNCKRKVIKEHEQGHVKDNEKIMRTKIRNEILKEPFLKAVFTDIQWYPRNSFSEVQSRIQSSIVTIFQKLTGIAVNKRDTPKEYTRINHEINKCKIKNSTKKIKKK